MVDELDVMNWTSPQARDALTDIFDTGFTRAEEGRPYDYADEIIRRLHEAGFVINPILSDDKWVRELTDAKAEMERLREAIRTLTSSWEDAYIGGAVRRGPWIDRQAVPPM